MVSLDFIRLTRLSFEMSCICTATVHVVLLLFMSRDHEQLDFRSLEHERTVILGAACSSKFHAHAACSAGV